jgi:hypothetical protein
MLNLDLIRKASFDWKETAQYYYGSSHHQPPLPDIDGKLEEKFKMKKLKKWRMRRRVVVDVVEDLVQQGTLEVVDDMKGIWAEKFFMKLPQEEKQRQTAGVFAAMKSMEERCCRNQKFACRVCWSFSDPGTQY